MTDLVQKLVGALEGFMSLDRQCLRDIYGSEFLSSVDAALSEAKAGGWQSMESAPRDGSMFLCWVETVIAIGKKHFPKTTLSNAWFGFAADIALAALQAQPAEVSDAEVDNIIEQVGQAVGFSPLGWDCADPREIVRAILALRPQAVPMTDAWAAGVQAAADLLKRMADETALERGETDPDTGAIQFKSAATREWHASLCGLAEEIERLKPAHQTTKEPR